MDMPKKDADRIARIRRNEALFDSVADALRALDGAAEVFAGVRPAREKLRAYYESDLWKKDFAADENGLLPPDLKRGVLSEDGVWLLLEAAEKWDAALRAIEE